jgi:hypothetical protein
MFFFCSPFRLVQTGLFGFYSIFLFDTLIDTHSDHCFVRRNRQKRCASSFVRPLRKALTFALIDSSVFVVHIFFD